MANGSWTVTDPEFLKRIDAVFSPYIRLVWNRRSKRYIADARHRTIGLRTVWDADILRQFMEEAGLPFRNGEGVTDETYDRVLEVAGRYGYAIETTGHPEDE